MKRLSVRLVLSHLVVAVLAVVTTYVVVRQLAPNLFDASLHGTPQGMGPGAGGAGARGLLREQMAAAVNQALLVGTLVGAALATVVGVLAAHRLIRPITRVRAATRSIAEGRYAAHVTPPAEQELAELAHDINRLGSTLAATEERRLHLLGDVAHEMRTPLTVLDATLEGMVDGVVPADATELGRLGEETRRLRRLADDLSALSRTQEHRVELDLQPLDLGQVASTAAERLRPQADDAELELVIGRGPDGIPVSGDADRLAQVVTNLVGNAIRATPRGGRVEVSTRREGRFAELTVRDTGEGLAAADLERVFERFYRVRRPGRAVTGTGVGLTIARSLVEAHGGTLTATSEGPDRGATFTLRLPVRD